MKEEFDRLKIEYDEDVDLKNYNTMRLNSMCYMMVHPKDIQELKSVFSIVKEYKTKFFVLGNGSNVLLPEYYDGVIIKLDKFKKLIFNNGNVYVSSGYMLNKLASKLSSLGYTGLEWATGIPGTIGGAIYSNAGAYLSSISDIFVNALIFEDGELKEYSKENMKFDYRSSVLRDNHELIVVSCNLRLEKGNISEIQEKINSRTKRRVETQPLNFPSCGSVFRNPDIGPAGKLIEDSGYKGYSVGDASISKKHANFIINTGEATQKDVLSIIKTVKKDIKKIYNVDLLLEQEIIK